MSYEKSPVNPHPKPTRDKLAQIDGRLLADLLIIAAHETISSERRTLSGILPIENLESELRRRQSADQAVGL